MLQSLRKFSSTRIAQVVIAIIAIPFVLWGMGDVFSGSKNTIVKIDNEKINIQSFINYANSLNINFEDLNDNSESELIDSILSNFITKKILQKESENYNVKISPSSLSQIIKQEEIFKDNNKFSRTKYEKFLITSKLDAKTFEDNFKEQETKRLLFDFIGSGIKAPKFLVNKNYNLQNQTREIEIISLENYYSKKIDLSFENISDYFNENQDNYKKDYRSIKYIDVNPKNLINENDFNNIFFQKLDEIEDLLANENSIDSISKKFNLNIKKSELFDKSGFDVRGEKVINFDSKIIDKIFKAENVNDVSLIDDNNNYIVVSINSIENKLPDINSKSVKEKIIYDLKINKVIENNLELAKKIKNENFYKSDLHEFANKNNLLIKNLKIENLNDEKNFKKDVVKKIYKMHEKKINIISNTNLSENFIVYLNKINNKKINLGDKNYERYVFQTNNKIKNEIYQTYDQLINNKYDVIVNDEALKRVKNYFK